jgi:type II secretory pathway component PulF
MIWKYVAITKGMGKKLSGVFQGTRDEALRFMDENELIVVDLDADYEMIVKDLFKRKTLSNITMATFFHDFGMSCESGMNVSEALTTLGSTTMDPLLKTAIRKILCAIGEGQSLKTAFESTSVFPRMISTSIDAAEKSGNIPEVVTALSEFLKFTDETTKRIIHAFIYPAVLFVAITILTIVISTTLVPKLSLLLPEKASTTLSAKIFLSYSYFMQHYWWLVLLIPFVAGGVIHYLWRNRRNEFVTFLYTLPRIGELIKEISLSRFFMCLGVYLKSGVPINDAITSIHEAYPTHLTQKMMICRDYIVGGLSFWSALERDTFFPAFVSHNIRKGETQGQLKEYVYKVSRHYEKRARSLIEVIVAVIGPAMVVFAVIVFAFIVLTFFMPIYTNIGNMAEQLYQ